MKHLTKTLQGNNNLNKNRYNIYPDIDLSTSFTKLKLIEDTSGVGFEDYDNVNYNELDGLYLGESCYIGLLDIIRVK